jgi:hypothetical protein
VRVAAKLAFNPRRFCERQSVNEKNGEPPGSPFSIFLIRIKKKNSSASAAELFAKRDLLRLAVLLGSVTMRAVMRILRALVMTPRMMRT